MAIIKNFRVESFDVDAFSLARPSALMQKMQQLAGEDLIQYGTGYSQMRAQGHVLVLFASKLHLHSPLRTNDEYRLESYSIGTHGATFTRDFYCYRNGEEVGLASTKWVLLDFEKRKIVPPSRLDAPLGHFPEKACSLTVQFVNIAGCRFVMILTVCKNQIDTSVFIKIVLKNALQNTVL